MEKVSLDNGLGRRRHRRRKSKGLGAARKGRKGRKICIRTAAGNKVCGVRWRRRRRK